jgi:phosphoglycolate phosphatase
MEWWNTGIMGDRKTKSTRRSNIPLFQYSSQAALDNNIMDRFEKRDQFRDIKAVVFDFDGTLAVLNIDFSQMRDQVFKLVRNHEIDESSIEEKYLLEIIDEVALILSKRNSSAAEEFYQKAHLILHEIEMKAAEEGRMIPGAKEALISLKREGIKVGIVTRNCEEAVRKILPDIETFCDVFISRDSIKKVKPHPEQLTSVLKALHVAGQETVMVGDHTIDIQAGKRMGMRTVGVLTGRTERDEFKKAGADHILKEVTDIYRLLEGEKV